MRKAADTALAQRVKNPPEGASGTAIKRLLETMESGDPEEKFPVYVSGCTLWFRYPANVGEMNAFYKGGAAFVEQMNKGLEKGNLPPPFAQAFGDVKKRPLGDDDLITAWTFHFWSHESERIDQTQAIRMVRANPVMCSEMMIQIDQVLRHGQMSICVERAFAAKKDSGRTRPNGSARRPPSSTSDAIRAN